jgi:hypothetical protein
MTMPPNRAPDCKDECQQAVDYGVSGQHSCSPTCVYRERIRAEFERWYGEGGTYLRAVEREGDTYKLMSAHIAWVTWQAAYSACARRETVSA